MFGSDIIDTGVGLFLAYFLFSALCSAINEWIVGHIFKWRAEILERSLARILGGEQTAKEFFDQPLIQSMATDGKARPSYLSASTFIDGLIALVKNKAATAQPPIDAATLSEIARDPQKLLAALEKVNNPKLQSILQSLLDGAKDIETARKKLELWFNEGMDRATGWYKRHIRVCMIGIAVAVAVIFNVDTFTIVRALMSNSKLRATLVAAAQETVKQPANSTTNALPSIEAIETQIKDLELPIGWPRGENVSKENPNWVLNNVMPLRPGETWGMKVWSLLLTAVALSFGAPFWFDLLNKVVNLRATGKKPELEQGKKGE